MMLLPCLIQNHNCLIIDICLNLNTYSIKCQLLWWGKRMPLEYTNWLTKHITFKIKIGKMVENAPWTEIWVSQRLLYEIIILSLIKSSFMIAQTPENPWSLHTVFTKHNKFFTLSSNDRNSIPSLVWKRQNYSYVPPSPCDVYPINACLPSGTVYISEQQYGTYLIRETT